MLQIRTSLLAGSSSIIGMKLEMALSQVRICRHPQESIMMYATISHLMHVKSPIHIINNIFIEKNLEEIFANLVQTLTSEANHWFFYYQIKRLSK